MLQTRLNQSGSIFKFRKTDYNEVQNILKKLKRKKVAGSDGIPVTLIIDGASEIATPLSYLINSSLEDCMFPSSGKCAKVTPIC